jgi:hypothetical protein
MRRVFLSAAFLLLAAPASQASDALVKCRAIANGAERLACYDAIPADAARAATAATPSAQSAPATRPATTATPAAPSAAASSIPATASFGLTQRTPDADIQAINTEIVGEFDGWGPSTRIRLRNGQVWQVDDGSTGVCGCTNPKVKVSRGLFGVFYLEIEGKGHSPKVRRVQ